MVRSLERLTAASVADRETGRVSDYAVSSMVTVGVSYSSQTGRRASDNAFKGHVDVSF
jgi:hypothetical protein